MKAFVTIFELILHANVRTKHPVELKTDAYVDLNRNQDILFLEKNRSLEECCGLKNSSIVFILKFGPYILK